MDQPKEEKRYLPKIAEKPAAYGRHLEQPRYTPPAPKPAEPAPQKQVDLSRVVVGCQLRHKAFGMGTVKEIQKEELQTLIYESQQTLENTDYRVIKFMDKYIQTHPEALAEFEAEYPDTLEKRQDARDAINGAQAQAETAGINLS